MLNLIWPILRRRSSDVTVQSEKTRLIAKPQVDGKTILWRVNNQFNTLNTATPDKPCALLFQYCRNLAAKACDTSPIEFLWFQYQTRVTAIDLDILSVQRRRPYALRRAYIIGKDGYRWRHFCIFRKFQNQITTAMGRLYTALECQDFRIRKINKDTLRELVRG